MAKTFLLAWELGGGLGHIARLAAISTALQAQGHRCVYVLRTLIGPHALLENDPSPRLAAPLFPQAYLDLPRHAVSFADLLAGRGFLHPELLKHMCGSWQALFDLVRPDLIIADFSPTASLTAFGRIPVVHVSNGFCLPPDHLAYFPPYPSREDKQGVDQGRILAVVRHVLKQRGQNAPDQLPALMSGVTRAVCTLPVMDPYRHCRKEPYYVPIDCAGSYIEPPEDAGIFVYCKSDYAHIEQLCAALAERRLPVSMYMLGRSLPLTRFMQSRGIRCYSHPPDLAEVLPAAKAVIHHSGLGLAHHAFIRGRPQLLLSTHFEGAMTARALQKQGVAWHWNSDYPKPLVDVFHAFCEDRDLQQGAVDEAKAIHAQVWPDTLEVVVKACLEHA